MAKTNVINVPVQLGAIIMVAVTYCDFVRLMQS